LRPSCEGGGEGTLRPYLAAFSLTATPERPVWGEVCNLSKISSREIVCQSRLPTSTNHQQDQEQGEISLTDGCFVSRILYFSNILFALSGDSIAQGAILDRKDDCGIDISAATADTGEGVDRIS